MWNSIIRQLDYPIGFSHIECWRKLEHMELQSALMIPQNGNLSVSFIVWVGMYCITWQLWTALKIVLLCMKLQKVEQLPDLPTITSRDEMLVKRRRNLELAWNSSPYYIEKTKAKCGKFSATEAFESANCNCLLSLRQLDFLCTQKQLLQEIHVGGRRLNEDKLVDAPKCMW